jgi:hypothetical protein
MKRQGTLVYFDQSSYEEAYLAAWERERAGPVTKAAGVALGSLTPFQIELLGTMGEMAAAYYYMVSADLSVRNKRRSNDADITVRSKTANIKATHIPRRASPHLLVRDYDTSQDFYIAVSVSFEHKSVDMLGYVTRKKLLTYDPKPFKHPDLICRAIPLADLSPCKPVVEETPLIEFDDEDLKLIDELTDGYA